MGKVLQKAWTSGIRILHNDAGESIYLILEMYQQIEEGRKNMRQAI